MPALRTFWSDIRVESRKAKIVRYNEMGLSEALDDAGIAWETMFAPEPGAPRTRRSRTGTHCSRRDSPS